MMKRMIILTVLVAALGVALSVTLSGCSFDPTSLRGDAAATATVAGQVTVETETSEMLPMPSQESTLSPVPVEANPTAIVEPTATLDVKDIQIGEAPEPVAVESPAYVVQPGTPVKMENFLQPTAGCNWTGVAGQVFDSNDLPVTGLIVEVGGKLEGSDLLRLTLSGGSQALGPGGYEVYLTDHVVASEQELYVQLFDLNGTALSDQFYFDTYPSCEQNLVLVNFVHFIEFTNFLYFPIVEDTK